MQVHCVILETMRRLQIHCSRGYSGEYEGCRFTVAEVILETMMKVAGSL